MSVSYRRSDEAIFSPLGDDIVALHIPKGRCYGMEDVTAAVWNLLDEPRDVDEICAILMRQYEVDPAVCRSDVAELLELFLSEGLVEVRTDGVPTG